MFPLLFLIPVFVSLFLGVAYVRLGSAGPGIKLAGILVFAIAVYLQFSSRFALAGLLIQIALALSLVLRRRMDTQSP